MSGLPTGAWSTFTAIVRERLSLTADKADEETIDEELRAAVEIRGANLWVLIFAIFIASIGLNLNSTAVIIGAMLISPLMGPIMGVGYGLGIFDFHLIRRSLKNLAISAGIALATSSIYFLFSPLADARSELLARTSPAIWDVLIALRTELRKVEEWMRIRLPTELVKLAVEQAAAGKVVRERR